jgi:hypothetical protein
MRIGGRRVIAEQRWLVVLPLTTVAPGVHLPSTSAASAAAAAAAAAAGDASGALTVDALCWREVNRKKTFSKAVRFGDIAAVVMGTRSPVFQARALRRAHAHPEARASLPESRSFPAART